eukprot:SAG31_NODE_719_length_12605_cov_22.378858_9_plen_170_part_00
MRWFHVGMPTLCELVGGCPMPSAQPLDGVSAVGALTAANGKGPHGESSNRTEIFHDICLAWMGGSCLEHLDQEGGPYQPHAIYASLMRGDWKIMIGQNKNNYTANLFNLRDDIGEKNDLAQTEAGQAKVAELYEAIMEQANTAGMAHDRDPIDPKSNPKLHVRSLNPSR